MELPAQQVEKKLSQMILDKAFSGVIEQSTGILVLQPPLVRSKIYDIALETIEGLELVIDALYEKAQGLA